MFKRFLNIVKGTANKGLKKIETPELLAEQVQMELEDGVKKLKEACIDGITTEKKLEQQLFKASKDSIEWQKRAELSVKQNNDDIARQCLQKRQEANQSEEDLKGQVEAQKQANQNLKKRLTEMEKELKEFHTKKKALIARGQAGDAIAKSNDLLSSSGGSGSSAMDVLESKIREKEIRNQAMAEIQGDTKLEEQFDSLGSSADLELELLAMKEQMSSPKLITSDSTGGQVSPKLIEEVTEVEVEVEIKEE
ncbi:MAG: PspA/IM30 family protein [Candidatus Obscuribacterales bacterium]|nr:PspA/IM30 family protein [Candidatus Obscuribacterales bacterium]